MLSIFYNKKMEKKGRKMHYILEAYTEIFADGMLNVWDSCQRDPVCVWGGVWLASRGERHKIGHELAGNHWIWVMGTWGFILLHTTFKFKFSAIKCVTTFLKEWRLGLFKEPLTRACFKNSQKPDKMVNVWSQATHCKVTFIPWLASRKWGIRGREAGQVERKSPARKEPAGILSRLGGGHQVPLLWLGWSWTEPWRVTCPRKQFPVTQRGSGTEAFFVTCNSATDTIREITIQLISRVVESVMGASYLVQPRFSNT